MPCTKAMKSPSTTKQQSAPVLLEPYTEEEQQVFRRLDPARIPGHVAIIMDGNGRWARERSLPERIHGHRAGADAVDSAVRTAAHMRVKVLTLFAFSTENWSRPQREISALMHLLETYLIKEIPGLNENNVRLVASGRIGDLPASARNKLAHTIEATSKNTGLILNLALSYGGRQEIVDAARRMAEAAAAGTLEPADITAQTISQHLYLPDLPDPELLIRTSGEQRLSNFLLWQCAYTEFVFLPVHWPDFRRLHFLQALEQYLGRDRRFGGIR